MRQVIKHREIKLLKMIRRTDPVIPNHTRLRHFVRFVGEKDAILVKHL